VAASPVPHAEILEFIRPQLKAQGVDLQVKVSPEGELIAGHMTPEQEAELAKQHEPAASEEAAEGSE